MFVRKSLSHGRIYLSFVQGYRDENGKVKQKTIQKLGYLDDLEKTYKNPIEYFKQQAQQKNDEEINKLIIDNLNTKEIDENSNQKNLGYFVLKKIYKELGISTLLNQKQKKLKIDFNLDDILAMLVNMRILKPGSKKDAYDNSNILFDKINFSLDDVYRCLTYLSPLQQEIQKTIWKNTKDKYNRDTSKTYYDCTNYFFEIEYEDDFKKYGISKQHQPSPLVGMGLFMDGDGLPLSCNIYPGNQNEQKTLIPEETKIVNNFKLDSTKIILCTDAGLSSDEIKKFNVKDNRGFVITQSLKKLKEDYKTQVFDKSDWRIPGDLKNIYNLDTIENNETLREKYYETLFYKIIQTETKSVKQDLIVTFCFKYFDYNKNIRDNQIERAKKSIETNNVSRKGKNQNDYRRFINSLNSTDNGEIAENTSYSINEDLINEESKYDGYYALTTNLVGDINEIFKIY